LRPGLAFLTPHFPDEVPTNILTIDATDPKSGTAEFKATAVRIDKLEPALKEETASTETPVSVI
jgi:formate dehydrogenase major subunit